MSKTDDTFYDRGRARHWVDSTGKERLNPGKTQALKAAAETLVEAELEKGKPMGAEPKRKGPAAKVSYKTALKTR